MNTFEKKAKEARNQELRIETLSSIYTAIENAYHWECCEYNGDTGEYIEPVKPENYSEADGNYEDRKYFRAAVYQEILKMVVKAI